MVRPGLANQPTRFGLIIAKAPTSSLKTRASWQVGLWTHTGNRDERLVQYEALGRPRTRAIPRRGGCSHSIARAPRGPDGQTTMLIDPLADRLRPRFHGTKAGGVCDIRIAGTFVSRRDVGFIRRRTLLNIGAHPQDEDRSCGSAARWSAGLRRVWPA